MYGWSNLSRVFHVINSGARGWQRTDRCGERWIDEWSTKRPFHLNPCDCVLYAQRMAEYQADLEARRSRLAQQRRSG